MKNTMLQLTYEIELQPGEKLALPTEMVERIGPGRWLVTVQPAPKGRFIRDHSAFLNSYAPEDEGLYDDDYPAR